MADRTTVRLVLDQAALRQALTGPQSEAVALLGRAQRRVLLNAKQRAPVNFGNLRNSHKATPIVVSGTKVSGAVVADAAYALPVHEGSRPHVIRPAGAKVLSWIGGNGRVFAREVHHPGAPPRPWLRNAAVEEGASLGFTPR